jgi:hypothetical protein
MNNPRTEQIRRERDLEFIDRVRAASLEVLFRMLQDHEQGPDWKIAAIRRRIELAQRATHERRFT